MADLLFPELWGITFSLGCVVAMAGCVFAAVNRKFPLRPRLLLAAWLLCLALILFEYSVLLSGNYHTWPHLIFVSSFCWYWLGPLFFLFVRERFSERQLQWSDAIHLFPGAWAAVLTVPFYLQAAEAKIAALEAMNVAAVSPGDLFPSLLLLVYQFAAWRLVRRHEVRYKSQQSGTGGEAFRPMTILTAVYFFYTVAELTGLTTLRLTGLFLNELIVVSALSLTVFALAAWAMFLRFPQELFPVQVEADPEPPSSGPEVTALVKRLVELMESDEPYLEPDLRLGDLAAKLEVTRHTLSAALNRELNTSFYDFVNGYRVAETQKRLLDPAYQHYSILAIGFDCGFNSKASFNRIFRNVVGQTPSAYRKMQLATSSPA